MPFISKVSLFPVPHFRDAAKNDIVNALRVYVDLHPSTDTCEFPAVGRKLSVVLNGTIPVVIRGATYNIPVRIELWDKHPYYAPLCFVRPTADMMVKPSANVDPHGKVFMPYLAEWSYPSHNTQDLLQVNLVHFFNYLVFKDDGDDLSRKLPCICKTCRTTSRTTTSTNAVSNLSHWSTIANACCTISVCGSVLPLCKLNQHSTIWIQQSIAVSNNIKWSEATIPTNSHFHTLECSK